MKAILPLLCLSLTACSPTSFNVTFNPRPKTVQETAVIDEPGSRKDKIALIDVRGVISDSPDDGIFTGKENSVDQLVASLNHAASDDDVKAVIVRINSPGGSVTASDIMHRELTRFRSITGKPVVVSMGEVAASGGYFLSLAADEIVAEPTTITGSIGVIIPTMNVSMGLSRLGIISRSITSGPNKAIANPSEPPEEEHYELLQGVVDDFYARFKNQVLTSRSIEEQYIEQATDGRIMTGIRAKEIGLVDHTGGIRLAFLRAKTLAGVERARLMKYHRSADDPQTPYALTQSPTTPSGTASTQLNLLQLNLPGATNGSWPTAYYLWIPPGG